MSGSIHSKEDSEAITGINVTPFVDVVLVLLVIFMITAKFMPNRGTSVQLPSASHTEPIQGETFLEVILTKNGAVQLDGLQMSIQELQQKILHISQNKTQKTKIIISAHPEVIYQHIVTVMDTLKQTGIYEIGLKWETKSPTK